MAKEWEFIQLIERATGALINQAIIIRAMRLEGAARVSEYNVNLARRQAEKTK